MLMTREDCMELLARESGLLETILIEARVNLFRGDSEKLRKFLGFASIDGNSLLQSHELIEFPYFDPSGVVDFSRFKLVPPRGSMKYLQPKGVPTRPYILPRVWDVSQKTNRPVWIVEGEKKALKLIQHGEFAIALPGIWMFRNGEIDPDRWDLSEDLQSFAWGGRSVFLGFDADLWVNPQVRMALWELALRLHTHGSLVRFATWPPEHKGIDDYLVAGEAQGTQAEEMIRNLRDAAISLPDFISSDHQAAVLRALALVDLSDLERGKLIRATAKKIGATAREIQAEIKKIHARVQTEAFKKAGGDFECPYRIGENGIYWLKPVREGHIPVQLTNFVAEIVADTLEDNGVETRRGFQIKARMGERTATAFVPVERFMAMDWPVKMLGAKAQITPGSLLKEHARSAVQTVSNNIVLRHVYTHLGWRKIGSNWIFLHAGGGIGAAGSVEGIEVSLRDELSRFVLPSPPEGPVLVAAVRASLRLLDIGPLFVIYPLFCSVWRPVVPGFSVDFSLFLSGATGEGKSELAALPQQHYGSEMTARRLPCSWSSTGNALEGIAFLAKDVLLTIDDFCPTGSTHDVQRLHREADRILRAQGNLSGRQRMRSDGSLATTRYPQGMIVGTGEEIPRGSSLRSRLFILDVERNRLDWERITAAQTDAAQGVYAQAMAGFIQWVAGRYDEIAKQVKTDFIELRSFFAGAHKRIPSNAANLAIGLKFFLSFAQEIGALDEEEAASLWKRGIEAITVAAARQEEYQHSSDPVRQFIELLAGALASGRAHVASQTGEAPFEAKAWGWRSAGTGNDWRPQGDRIGWLKEGYLFLEPQASYRLAQVIAKDCGEALTVTRPTLQKMLYERGLLLRIEKTEKETKFAVKESLEGRRPRVLCVSEKLFEAGGEI